MAPSNFPSSSNVPLTPGAIDLAAALTLLGGNHALHEQVAQAFLEEIQTFPQRLAPLLQAVDLSEAMRSLHTIKGLALTVGAIHLGETCRESEQAIKAALKDAGPLGQQALERIGAQVSASVAATTQTMRSALGGLKLTNTEADTGIAADTGAGTGADTTAGASGANGATAEKTAPAGLLADLQQLESLLQQSDMRAVDVHKQLVRVHGAAWQGRLEPLNAALHAFDFERGVVQCGELIRALADPN